MSVLELSRDVADKRRFVLSSIGTATREKRLWRAATTLEAPGHPPWRITAIRLTSPVFRAVDPDGVERASFVFKSLAITVGERRLHLEPTPAGWVTKAGDHRLVEHGRDLAGFEPRMWGRQPVRVTVHDEALLSQPMLLLFATFAADRYATYRSATPNVGSVTD